jgi:hypothetical protein
MFDEQEWIDLLRRGRKRMNNNNDNKADTDEKKDDQGDADANTGAQAAAQPQAEVHEILWLLCFDNQMYPVLDPATDWQTWLMATPENREKLDRWLAENPYNHAPPRTGAVFPYFN